MSAQHTEKFDSKVNENDILIDNLTVLMHKHKVNEAELARRTGIPQPTLHKILSGKTADPRISTLQQLASYFEVSLDALYSYDILQENKAPSEGKSIPIISWSECIKAGSLTKTLTANNWDKWAVVDNSNSQQSYGLTSRASMEPHFPRGTTLIVDPTVKPDDGDLVIVQYPDTQEATLRELSIDGPDQLLLSPYKKAEPEQLSDTIKILGTVVQSRFSY